MTNNPSQFYFWVKNYKKGRKVTNNPSIFFFFWVKKLQNGPKSEKLSIEFFFFKLTKQLFEQFYHKFTILGTIFLPDFFSNFFHIFYNFFLNNHFPIIINYRSKSDFNWKISVRFASPILREYPVLLLTVEKLNH